MGLALGLRKATGEGEGRKNFPLAAPIPFPFDYTKVPSFLQFNMAVLNNRKHGAPNENACKASYLRGGCCFVKTVEYVFPQVCDTSDTPASCLHTTDMRRDHTGISGFSFDPCRRDKGTKRNQKSTVLYLVHCCKNTNLSLKISDLSLQG